MLDVIDSFSDEHFFLSNYYESNVLFEGRQYPSAENAFQAAKNASDVNRIPFMHYTPSQAKEMGRKAPLRPDWDEVRLTAMKTILAAKFKNPGLRKKLLDTEGAELVEGNTWHDNFYGLCRCEKCRKTAGQNHLGRILMELRAEYKRLEEMKRRKPETTMAILRSHKGLFCERPAVVLGWDEASQLFSNLLSGLLLRKVEIDVAPFDSVGSWYGRFLNGPLLDEEVEYLSRLAGQDKDSPVCWSIVEGKGAIEAGDTLLSALLSVGLPFRTEYSYNFPALVMVSAQESEENTLYVILQYPEMEAAPDLAVFRSTGEADLRQAARDFTNAIQMRASNESIDRISAIDMAIDDTTRMHQISITLKTIHAEIDA